MACTIVSLFNLTGETISTNPSVAPELDSQYWNASTAPLPPGLTPGQSLIVSRDSGITDGKVYTFTLNFEVDGCAVAFLLQLTGTSLGSDWNLDLVVNENDLGWWSDNDSRTYSFEGNSGAMNYITATPIYRIGSSRWDIILTVGQGVYNPGTTYQLGQQIFTNGGLVNVTLEESGLVMTRTMFNEVLWQSPNPNQLVANTASIQEFGNLVVYDVNGQDMFEVGTTTTPNDGAYVQLLDTPDLQLMSLQSAPLSSLNLPAIDWNSPVYLYSDASGYSYCETSEYWKNMCQDLPCTLALAWPDYETQTFEMTLNGQPAVVQVWRGHCQRFLGDSWFPGGYGAEVGVYTRQPYLPSETEGPGDKWWPAPHLVQSISFRLINLDNGNSVFFESLTENTYWNCKWMTPDSYNAYVSNLGPGNTPPHADRYQLEFEINGGETIVWPGQT